LDAALYSWKVVQPVQIAEPVLGKSGNDVEWTVDELEPVGLDEAPQRVGNGQSLAPAAAHQKNGVTRAGSWVVGRRARHHHDSPFEDVDREGWGRLPATTEEWGRLEAPVVALGQDLTLV
jgi:hypothetical protein